MGKKITFFRKGGKHKQNHRQTYFNLRIKTFIPAGAKVTRSRHKYAHYSQSTIQSTNELFTANPDDSYSQTGCIPAKVPLK